MSRHLLVYWPSDVVCYKFNNIEILAHDASNQFEQRHIAPGGILWYVTVSVDEDGQRTGQQFLFGRLEVAAIVHTTAEAQRYLTNTFGRPTPSGKSRRRTSTSLHAPAPRSPIPSSTLRRWLGHSASTVPTGATA